MTIIPVLMCGGAGTRLWPLSRKSYPKQFVPLVGEETLFQSAARRLSGPGYGPPVVITNAAFRFIVTEQLREAGIDPGAVLVEPEGRNTAPAILAAALYVQAQDPDALILVSPADHVVPDAEAFRAAVATGAERARAGDIVTFGITPTRPETGYGYLELSEKSDGRAVPLTKFVEKPSAETAQAMLDAGRYLWNSGIFLFSARTIIEAFKDHAPDLIEPVGEAMSQARADLGFLKLAAEPWRRVRDISIDYAVMEQARNIAAVPFGGKWSDLGGWDAVWSEGGPDADGVVTFGNAHAVECRDVLLRSEAEGQELVGIGLEGIIAVAMPDAVLVVDKSRAQDVKKAVSILKEAGAPQAVQFPRDHRPWGHFESLARGSRFQVKRIVVNPGQALSLQSHVHRAEHWIVVEGTAKVTIDDSVQLIGENQSVYIPLGAKHRLENPGKVPMILIEVQTGSYLGEDDIVRYQDDYARDKEE